MCLSLQILLLYSAVGGISLYPVAYTIKLEAILPSATLTLPAYRCQSPGWSTQACPVSVSCQGFLSTFSSQMIAVSLCLLSVPLVF